MTSRHVVVGVSVLGLALAVGCGRPTPVNERTVTDAKPVGRSGIEAPTGLDSRLADAAAAARTAGSRAGVAGVAAEPDQPPAPPPAPQARRAKRERWPKPAQVTGTETQLEGLPQMRGISVQDHGQQRVHPDRWRIQVDIADPRAAAALRARGIKVELGEYPTAEELREDIGPAPSRAKPRR